MTPIIFKLIMRKTHQSTDNKAKTKSLAAISRMRKTR